jgi:hypothetical protein
MQPPSFLWQVSEAVVLLDNEAADYSLENRPLHEANPFDGRFVPDTEGAASRWCMHALTHTKHTH